MTIDLDDKDKFLLNLLQKDSRTPYSQIAEKIGVNEATVRYRIKKLVEKGIIQKFTVLLNPKKIGYSTTGILMVKIIPNYFENAAKQISILSETHHVFENTGEYNVVAVVQAHDLGHLSDLRKKIEKIKGVREVSLSATTRLIKIKTSFDI